ncbi:MAG: hypothetical protein Q9M10_02190 [Mariprofundaceae bacterium]|nr:hypothetical protein [Mariprofundaceae bacterium]
MDILTTFKNRTLGIEPYLNSEEEWPINIKSKALHKNEVIKVLCESPIFYYRFSNGERLWNITQQPFYEFEVKSAWEEPTLYPNQEEVKKWLQSL